MSPVCAHTGARRAGQPEQWRNVSPPTARTSAPRTSAPSHCLRARASQVQMVVDNYGRLPGAHPGRRGVGGGRVRPEASGMDCDKHAVHHQGGARSLRGRAGRGAGAGWRAGGHACASCCHRGWHQDSRIPCPPHEVLAAPRGRRRGGRARHRARSGVVWVPPALRRGPAASGVAQRLASVPALWRGRTLTAVPAHQLFEVEERTTEKGTLPTAGKTTTPLE